MKTVKVDELFGASLDWVVARAEAGEDLAADWHPHTWRRGGELLLRATPYAPSTDWSQGGPIIEREAISISDHMGEPSLCRWRARMGTPNLPQHTRFCPTPLVAAMRCYVASKLGDTVEIPEELT